MDVWRSKKWQKDTEIFNQNRRKSLRFKFDNDVDQEIRQACIRFGYWLRREFSFPIRVTIYFKSETFIRASDKEAVSAIFYEPISRKNEPYIKVATGDYQKLLKDWGRDNALGAILCSVAHELTHYFQWINNLSASEKQACYYRNRIISEYALTREHP